MTTLIRELAPLRLALSIATADGHVTRWGADEPRPENTLDSLAFSSTMPGGFENLSCSLMRQIERQYADLTEFSTITVQGPGGQVAWQGRLEQTPRVAGQQLSVTPQAVGWQAHLDDDKTARMVYVDIDLSHWQAASIQRKINLLTGSSRDCDDPTTAPDQVSGYPSLITQMTGPWSRAHQAEAWYDGRGTKLGALYYAWKLQAAGAIGDDTTANTHWHWYAYLSNDDQAGAVDITADLRSAGPGSGTFPATGTRKWAAVQLYADVAGGNDGVNYPLFWTSLAVYGNHGLPGQGAGSFNSAPGLLASDVIGHALRTWAPKLAYSTGPDGTVRPSTFVVPHLVFLDPVSASEIVKQGSRFGLQDWAVWEGPTFYWAPRGTFGRNWRARVFPANLQEAGPQVDRIWNSVMVQYNDVTGVTRTVGPVGSGADTEDPALTDPDPLNPATVAGIKRWALLQMGTSTPAGAIRIGQTFLAESKFLNTAGQADLVGHVEDDHGVLWPAWMVRAGDTLSVVDAADPSPRRVVKADYSHASRSCTVHLDSPPQALQALLERMSVVLVAIGFS